MGVTTTRGRGLGTDGRPELIGTLNLSSLKTKCFKNLPLRTETVVIYKHKWSKDQNRTNHGETICEFESPDNYPPTS